MRICASATLDGVHSGEDNYEVEYEDNLVIVGC